MGIQRQQPPASRAVPERRGDSIYADDIAALIGLIGGRENTESALHDASAFDGAQFAQGNTAWESSLPMSGSTVVLTSKIPFSEANRASYDAYHQHYPGVLAGTYVADAPKTDAGWTSLPSLVAALKADSLRWATAPAAFRFPALKRMDREAASGLQCVSDDLTLPEGLTYLGPSAVANWSKVGSTAPSYPAQFRPPASLTSLGVAQDLTYG